MPLVKQSCLRTSLNFPTISSSRGVHIVDDTSAAAFLRLSKNSKVQQIQKIDVIPNFVLAPEEQR